MDDYPHAHHCRHGLAGDTGDFRLQGHRFSGHHRKVTGYQWKWSYDYLEEGVSFYSQLSTAPKKLGENTTAQTLPPTRSRKTIFWKLTMKWWCRWASESACY